MNRLALALLLALPLAAEDPEFKLHKGLGDLLRRDRWTLTRVDARGGDRDFEGVLTVESKAGDGTSANSNLPVQLPRGSRKRFEVYHRLQGSESLQVTATDLHGKKVFEGELDPPASSPKWAVGILAPGLLGFDPYTQASGWDVAIVPLTPDDLPRRSWGLDAIDWLVWPDPDPQSLLPDQVEAIVDWVRAGGRLCLCVGRRPELVIGSPLAQLIPGTLGSPIEMHSLAVLEKPSRQPFPRFDSTLVPRVLPKGTVRYAQDDVPLVVEGRFGLGTVVLLAVDPLVPPLAAWPGKLDLWRDLLSLPVVNSTLEVNERPSPANVPYNYYENIGRPAPPPSLHLAQRMESAPLGETVSPETFAILFGAYILIVGVGDYVYWKLRKKWFGLWWMTPIWVVLFGYVSWWAGTKGRRGEDLIRSVAVFDRREADPAWDLHGVQTLYVGSVDRFSVRTSLDSGIVWPAAAPAYVSNGRSSLTGPTVDLVQAGTGMEVPSMRMYTASMLSFLAEGRGTVPELSGLRVAREKGDLVIENKTSIAWSHGWAVRKGKCLRLEGSLTAGALRRIAPQDFGWHDLKKEKEATALQLGLNSDAFQGTGIRPWGPQEQTDFGANAWQHALQVVLDPWRTSPRWNEIPSEFVTRGINEDCLILVTMSGPSGVAIEPSRGERVGATVVRIWLDGE